MFKATSVVSQLYWNIIEALFCLVYFFKVSPVKMALSAELSLANVVLLYTFVFASKYLWKLFQKWQLEKILCVNTVKKIHIFKQFKYVN